MKTMKFGVLGVSTHYGLRIHIPASHSPLVELTAIGSRNLERAKEAALKWGCKNAYASYQEVLDDPDVEVVFIPLPNNMHAEWIKKCADAGKAVLCEKPVALSAAEARDAFDYADKKGVPVMEAFLYRFHPQWIRAKELLDSGEIGDIMTIQTLFSFNNNDPNNIRNCRELGGGALYDIGCYAISTARFILGREPERVIAAIQYDTDMKVDILNSVILDFGGPRLQFTVSTRMSPRQKVSVYGSRGNLTIVRPFNAYPDVPSIIVINDGEGVRELRCGPADQYELMLEAFVKAVRNKQPLPIKASESIANMSVIDAVFRSAESGKWEKPSFST